MVQQVVAGGRKPGAARITPLDLGCDTVPSDCYARSIFAKREKSTLGGVEKCTRVEFKVTVCCLMTPIRMLIYSESL